MKKLISIFVSMTMLLSSVVGCSSDSTANSEPVSTSTPTPTATATPATQSTSSETTEETINSEKLKIVTTIFPIYDWTKEILGEDIDNVELTMLLNSGVDLHSFQPTTADIINIYESDLFVYVGGESDAWVESVLKNANTDDLKIVNLFDILGNEVKNEESIEGMQASSHDHDHEESEHEDHDHDESDHDDHDHDESDHDDHDHEDHDHEESEHEDHDHDHDESEHEHNHADEHVWLSLKNAEIICKALADELHELNNNDDYIENLNQYVLQLNELDELYQTTIENSSKDTLLFADRFPFRYLVDDYNLNYYAAFAGCSAETEASFETITFLSQKVDELDLNSVLILDGTNHKIATTVVSNTESKGEEILTIDSMQSVTSKDVEDGANYIEIMKGNLEVIDIALE